MQNNFICRPKIGVVFCCYGNPKYVNNCIEPWVALKGSYNIKIAAVHGQFLEYNLAGLKDDDFETQTILKDFNFYGAIDYLWLQNDYNIFYPDSQNIKIDYRKESDIRNEGLKFLLKDNIDYLFILDNDEFYSLEQIKNILDYIIKEDNEYQSWFSIPFKNYIFDCGTWISGFCPPRIFKIRIGNGKKLLNFYFDNDVYYEDGKDLYNYKSFPNKKIPENLLNGGIKHITWTHENGENKEKYQRAHFNGICSYKFNKEKNKLEFDIEGFYKKYNIPVPVLNQD